MSPMCRASSAPLRGRGPAGAYRCPRVQTVSMGTEHLSLDREVRRTRGGCRAPACPRNIARRHRAEAEEAFRGCQLSGVRGFGSPSSAPIRPQPGAAVLRGRDRQGKGSGTLPPRRGYRLKGRFLGVSPLRAASLLPSEPPGHGGEL